MATLENMMAKRILSDEQRSDLGKVADCNASLTETDSFANRVAAWIGALDRPSDAQPQGRNRLRALVQTITEHQGKELYDEIGQDVGRPAMLWAHGAANLDLSDH